MSVEASPPEFNPFDPNSRIDPYPTYSRLLAEAPVYRSPLGGVVLSRFCDCESVLRSHHVWSADLRNAAQPGLQPEVDLMGEARPFLFLDPPDHTRLRGLVSKAFTPRVVETLRPRIQEIVDEMLEKAARIGKMEVIEDLAYPLPVIVISEMLGVPADAHTRFRRWSAELASALDPEITVPPEVIERRRRAIAAFDDLFRELIAERRKNPREDLLSALIAAEEEGDRLSEAELIATCRLLLIAGHETTVNLIGNGVLQLLHHPDQLRLLRDNPELIASAVEEVLRYDPPVQLTGRIALEDAEFDGISVPKGQTAICLIGAANRDPERFEDGDRFDITRGEDRHLGFGFGIHYCLGAPLARLEGQVALQAVAQRFHGLRLAAPPRYKGNFVLRGLASLHVDFDSYSP